MNRKKLIAGNHKMYTTLAEGTQLAKDVHNLLKSKAEQVDILIIPPFTHLFAVSGILKNTPFFTGAQNCSSEKEGAYTGEISASMIQSTGASFVLVGHSERRNYFNETDEQLRRKIKHALNAGLQVIFCFGEPLKIREAGSYKTYILNQLHILKEFNDEEWNAITLAYEPVWAIGTGKNAEKEQAQEVHAFCRQWILENISAGTAQKTRILYGGSVKPGNAAGLLSMPDIDGALVGGASLQADSFAAIVNASLV
jgi:triosephosphate isomerase